MATATLTPPAAPASGAVRRLYRLSLAQYHRMVELGIIGPSDRCELIRGVMEAKVGQNNPHASASTRLERSLHRRLPDEWCLRTQKPFTIPTLVSEPEPDFAVVSGPFDRYDTRHPTPADTAVLIEVADSSLDYDAGDKLQLYAEAGVPEYWVVNIPDRRVEVYTQPSPAGYGHRRDYHPGDAVPVAAGGVALGAVPVAEVLP